jgi:hypothetical protein
MKRSSRCVLAPALVLFALAAASAPAQSVESLVEEGFYLEVGRCDPRAALEVYRRALAVENLPPRLEACVRLRMGIVHDTLGDEQSARDQFRTIVERFAAETDAVRVARRYLGSLVAEDPARFMPEEMLFYIELVEPGDELDHLAEALRGTPFENPIDSSRARAPLGAEPAAPEESAEKPAAARRSPTAVEMAAAYLNRSFFKEVGKIGGLAFGIPAGGRPASDHLGVASLGGSDVLQGIVTSFLAIEKPPRVGYARGLPVYRLRGGEDRGPPAGDGPDGAPPREREPVHLAFGGDVLVWGRPRRLVEEAVERFFSRRPSLASNQDFRAACASRPQSLVFAYLGPSWIDSLLDAVEESDRALISGLRRVLDLDSLRPVAARITSTALADAHHATVTAGSRGERERDVWSAFSTPALDPEVLRPVPPQCTGFLALHLGEGAERWRNIERAAADLAASLGAAEAAKLDAAVGALAVRLTTPPGKEILADLRSLVVGAVDGPRLTPFHSFFAVLELEDADSGEASLRQALVALARRLSQTDAGAEFRSAVRRAEDGEGAVEYVHHWLEPLPGVHPGYVRSGKRFVVSLSEAVLDAAARAAARPRAQPFQIVPDGASKVLFLRPGAIVRSQRRADVDTDPGLLILSHVERALVYTQEDAGGLALHLEVPELTPTLRAVLASVAATIEREAAQGEER